MIDTARPFEVFHCPSCGKPTTESAPACRHCHAMLKGPDAGKKRGAIFADEGPGAKWGCVAAMAFLIALACGGVSYCNHESAERAAIEAQQKVEEQKQEEAQYQERVRSGQVCADGPDDLNTAFELNVKRALKDPESFEHMGTVIRPSSDGNGYDALMRYRAKNSFGALTTGTAVGKLYLAERSVCEVRSYKLLE